MTVEERRTSAATADTPRRKVPIAWEALEDAFENNAPEVHSYLHLVTGEVIRVVDGVADPATHARIAADSHYMRVEPVSSREQYRWMERFIATVEEGPLRQKLLQSIDGKGAFRRFKDVLVGFPVDRERWFAFRSERLRTCMEGWLDAQGVEAVERPEWQVPSADDVRPQLESHERVVRRPVRGGALDVARQRAHDMLDALAPRELEAALTYLEFLRDRRLSGAPAPGPSAREGRELSLVSHSRDRQRDLERDAPLAASDDDADP
ncbi:MAG: UPF0158 family protein [Polyangiales bacterium]